jgi:threonine synthase
MAMYYVNTRGRSPAVSFERAILEGLAADGGLYVPETWPRMSAAAIASFRDKAYEEVVFHVLRAFVGGAIGDDALQALIAAAYRNFDTQDRASLSPLGENRWLLELFHGPTCAFKDFALQLVTRLQDYFLNQRGGKITILTATSGDTGAAAIEACRGLETVEIFVLHPQNKISAFHRRQMTTVNDPHVHNIAIEGTFDDCQALVKSALSDREFSAACNLSTLNSINWGRIVGQIAYYFSSAAQLGAPRVAPVYCVPTGNFGDVYSGYASHKMGLPISRLVVATNHNDILHRFFAGAAGTYERHEVRSTAVTPCMDIQAPSNFERVLFDLLDGNAEKVREMMQAFSATGRFQVGAEIFARARKIFASNSATEAQTIETLKTVYARYGVVVDPHTAVGIWAAEHTVGLPSAAPIVCLATAHPAKFPDTIHQALGDGAPLNAPLRLKQVMDDERAERFAILPNDFKALKTLMRRNVQSSGRRSIAAE